MSTIEPNKKIQKIRTELEMRTAISNLGHHKHAIAPPEGYDDEVILISVIDELLEARKLLASFDTTPYEKLSEEQKSVVNDFRTRISDILKENAEPFYKDNPDLVFSWGLSLNVFLRADKQEMQEL